MHELSVAMSILEIVEQHAERIGAGSVLSIRVKVGPLSGVAIGPLQSAFELAREDSLCPNCELLIDEIPIVAHCPACDVDRQIESPQAMLCPECGTPVRDVLHGRELDVAAMEVET